MERGGEKKIEVKVTDDVFMGRYANLMRVGHTPNEFILEFANAIGSKGIAVARLFISPGHLKRIIKALNENLKGYEDRFGEVREAEEPTRGIGF